MVEVLFREYREAIVAVRVTPEGLKRRAELLPQGRCLGCGNKPKPGDRIKKGQCPTCYQGTRRKIKAGKLSERTLIREGKWLEKSKTGRPALNDYTRELSEL